MSLDEEALGPFSCGNGFAHRRLKRRPCRIAASLMVRSSTERGQDRGLVTQRHPTACRTMEARTRLISSTIGP